VAGLVLTICGAFIAFAVLVVCARWPSETPEADARIKAEHEARFEQALGWPPGTYGGDVAERLASNERWAADQIATPESKPSTAVSARLPGTYPVMPEDMPSLPAPSAESDVIARIPGLRPGQHFDVRLYAWDLAPPVGDVPTPAINVEIFNPAAMGLSGEWVPNQMAVRKVESERQLPVTPGRRAVKIKMDAIQKVSKAIMDAGMPSEFHIDAETAVELASEYSEMRARAGMPPLDPNEPLVLANAQLIVDA
jgi:hypothetical protein